MRTIAILVALCAGCNQTEPAPAGKVQEHQELDRARSDLDDARDQYIAAARRRLAALDAKIHDLAMRADKSDTAAKLRARRDDLAKRIDSLKHEEGWQRLKQDLDAQADAIRKDIDDATR